MESKSIIDRHIAEAEAALADLDKEQAAIDRKREELVEELTTLRMIRDKRLANGKEAGEADSPQPNSGTEPGEADGPRYGSKRYRYEKAIEELLIESGTMHRIYILVHLRQQGIIGDERDPLANISNILSTSKKFKPVGSGIWGLASDIDESDRRAEVEASP